MTALDIAVLFLIGGGAVRGFMRGFVMEALSLAALIAAIIALRLFHAPVTAMLHGLVGSEGGAAMLAYLGLFFGILIGGNMLAKMIGSSTRNSVLGPVDRVLGLGFGAIKGLLVATVAFLGFSIIYDTLYGASEPRPQWMREARTYPLLSASGNAMSEWLEERRMNGGLMPGRSARGDEAPSLDEPAP
jgi:membrane protein required for colicin V production